jgi:hypothetical protein
MQQWEYLWIHVTTEKGRQVFVANGEQLDAHTYQEALNRVGKEGWELVAMISPAALSSPSNIAEFCLKRSMRG